MNRCRILLLALAILFLTLGKAHAQYAYVRHPNALVKQGATTAVLPANPLRAFVYCLIASPGKGQPLAPSVVTMGDATKGVPYTIQIGHRSFGGTQARSGSFRIKRR
jgi:hypothetical protein